jgi:rRNA maturation endonuclease Nob1
MINVSLSFDTVSDAADFFAKHLPAHRHVAMTNAVPTEEQRVEKIHAAEVKPDPKPAKAAKPAATQPTAEAAPADAPEVKAEPVAEVKKAEPATKSSIDYPTLQKAVFKLASISREACTEVAQQFGRTTFKDSPADIWDKALAAVNAKIEELQTAEVA